MKIDEKKLKDFSGGFKKSKGSKTALGVGILAVLAAIILSFMGQGDEDLINLLDQQGEDGTNPIANIVDDFLPGEEATGLFSGIGTLNCEADSYNCADFATQPEAQQAYDLCGGDDNDIHDLDRDDDEIACDGLPSGGE